MLRFCTCLTFYISYLLTVFSLHLKPLTSLHNFLTPVPITQRLLKTLSKSRPEKLANSLRKKIFPTTSRPQSQNDFNSAFNSSTFVKKLFIFTAVQQYNVSS